MRRKFPRIFSLSMSHPGCENPGSFMVQLIPHEFRKVNQLIPMGGTMTRRGEIFRGLWILFCGLSLFPVSFWDLGGEDGYLWSPEMFKDIAGMHQTYQNFVKWRDKLPVNMFFVFLNVGMVYMLWKRTFKRFSLKVKLGFIQPGCMFLILQGLVIQCFMVIIC